MGNPFGPLWARGTNSWSRPRIAWRFWERALRPIWFVFAGLSTITAFWSGRAPETSRPIRRPRNFDLGVAALVKCVMHRIYV